MVFLKQRNKKKRVIQNREIRLAGRGQVTRGWQGVQAYVGEVLTFSVSHLSKKALD